MTAELLFHCTVVESGCYAATLAQTSGEESWETDIRQAAKWLQQCQNLHTVCSGVSNEGLWNPTRLIHVDASGSVRLISTREQTRRLPYLTLTHCWGDTKPNSLSMKNIAAFESSIPVERLTKVVRDALQVTRGLGYQYLWVDYLCIIQDSPGGSDWSKEAARMAQVYSNSFCTIAASRAANGDDGLFTQRNHDLIVPRAITSRTRGKLFEHVPFDLHIVKENSQAKLYHRGWTLQEIILSKRIIHFGATRLHWSCDHHSLSFTFPHESPFNIFAIQRNENNLELYNTVRGAELRAAELRKLVEKTGMSAFDPAHKFIYGEHPEFRSVSPEDIILDERLTDGSYGSTATENSKRTIRSPLHNYRRALWRSFIHRYTRLQLTYESDRPIAFAGLSQVLGSLYKTEVVCGHAVNDLFVNLLWTSEFQADGQQVRGRRRTGWPSWSWLSVEGPLEVAFFQQSISYPKIKFIRFLTKGSDGVTGTELVVAGRLAQAWIGAEDKPISMFDPDGMPRKMGSRELHLADHDSENVSFDLPNPIAIFCDEPGQTAAAMNTEQTTPSQQTSQMSPSSKVYLLQVGGVGHVHDVSTPIAVGLVLRRLSKAKYRRIGVFHTHTFPPFGQDYGEQQLTTLVNAYDTFDKSKLAQELSSHKQRDSQLYEVHIV